MPIEIPKEKWTQFFKDVSKKRFAWETKIEVFSNHSGKSVLSNGLYLNGIAFEAKSGETGEIEILVSKNKTRHQTHSISNPTRVCYASEDKYHDARVEIEETDGTKTTLQIFNPMPIMVGYAARQSLKS